MGRGFPICERLRKKPASLMVWGCIGAYSMGSLHVLEGTMNAERYLLLWPFVLAAEAWQRALY